MAGRTGKRQPPDHVAGPGIEDDDAIRVANRDGHQSGAGIGDDPLGRGADPHHLTRRSVGWNRERPRVRPRPEDGGGRPRRTRR